MRNGPCEGSCFVDVVQWSLAPTRMYQSVVLLTWFPLAILYQRACLMGLNHWIFPCMGSWQTSRKPTTMWQDSQFFLRPFNKPNAMLLQLFVGPDHAESSSMGALQSPLFCYPFPTVSGWWELSLAILAAAQCLNEHHH